MLYVFIFHVQLKKRQTNKDFFLAKWFQLLLKSLLGEKMFKIFITTTTICFEYLFLSMYGRHKALSVAILEKRSSICSKNNHAVGRRMLSSASLRLLEAIIHRKKITLNYGATWVECRFLLLRTASSFNQLPKIFGDDLHWPETSGSCWISHIASVDSLSDSLPNN